MALNVLRPGTTSLKAPFSHLQFALYCSIRIIEQANNRDGKAYRDALPFLAEHLPLYPDPLCYLAWIMITHEAEIEVEFGMQLRVLGKLVEVLASPITMPLLTGRYSDQELTDFSQQLLTRGLDKTWRIWIYDYAERTNVFKAWELYSEACERDADLDGAEKSLRRIIETQIASAKRAARGRPLSQQDQFRMRGNVNRLFAFYRRTNFPGVEEAFKHYYRLLPELWNRSERSNSYLIGLTSTYLPQPSPQPQQPPSQQLSSPPPGVPSVVWARLYQELMGVQDIQGLNPLCDRLLAAIDLVANAAPRDARDAAEAIKHLLRRVCALQSARLSSGNLALETKELNNALHQSRRAVDSMAELKDMGALVTTLQKVFIAFIESQKIYPVPQLQPDALGGLPLDVSASAVVLGIHNPGPGDISEMRLTCQDGEAILATAPGVISAIPEDTERIITVPVQTTPPATGEAADCTVLMSYHWGILRDLTSEQHVRVEWLNFGEYLAQHGIHEYEFPNPYVFDTALDFSRHDRRLFQGRENELALIRTFFLSGRNSGAPLYFHGIRKVGKTSLLERVRQELLLADILPIRVDLKGIDPQSQSPVQVINSLTEKILTELRTARPELADITPVPPDHGNYLHAAETFFRAVAERLHPTRMVLLLDEFHLLVSHGTKPLLDLIRLVHQRDDAWFIMSGWKRPEIIREACPETELSLQPHAIDFLPMETVARVLREPMANSGIEIPDEAVERVQLQTAGNPYHVAKLAWLSVNRLNAQHRTIITPHDIDELAGLLARDEGNFGASSFSPLILNSDEQRAAMKFSRLLSGEQMVLPIAQAMEAIGSQMLIQLEQKYLIEKCPGGVRLRGKMLTTYLQNRLNAPEGPPLQPTAKSVGIFVDVENIVSMIPSGVSHQDAWKNLLVYAEGFGRVVAHWACADPRNLADPERVRLDLETAGFDVSFPSSEYLAAVRERRKEEADFLLIERISDEQEHTDPDIFIIVAGDRDYYPRISSLLDRGRTIRILADTSGNALANLYRDITEKRRKERFVLGFPETDLFLDDIRDALSPAGASVP
ncbi:MAG: NYN domain protein [bacterium ADurb.Bin429]|nr:MAG: NYN domain protein [bacterium ADurb.Bin429]